MESEITPISLTQTDTYTKPSIVIRNYSSLSPEDLIFSCIKPNLSTNTLFTFQGNLLINLSHIVFFLLSFPTRILDKILCIFTYTLLSSLFWIFAFTVLDFTLSLAHSKSSFCSHPPWKLSLWRPSMTSLLPCPVCSFFLFLCPDFVSF